MKEDKSAPEETVGENAEVEQPAVEEEAAAPAPAPAVEEGTAAKESFGAKALAFITPERILGLIAILLIPCFFTAWVNVTAAEKIGVKVELSMPDALSAGTSVVSTMQKASDAATEAKAIIDEAVNYIDKGVQVLGVITKALNSDSADYKAALTEAVTRLIDETVDDSTKAGSVVKSVATDAAGKAVDKGVDEAAAALEGTKAQENLDKAAENATTASKSAEEVQSKAKEVQSAAADAKAQYDSTLSMVKTILGVAKFVWFAFLLLLLVAGILLIVGLKGRYVTGIVAFALSSVASLGAIIGVAVANQVVLDAVVNAIGSWVLVFVPSVLAATGWPYVVVVASVVCLIALIVMVVKRRKLKKAAELEDGQVPLKPALVESDAPEVAEA